MATMAKTNKFKEIPEEFIVNIQGKDFIIFEGLIDLAHKQGLKNVKTELLQIPSSENEKVAITHALVETSKGIFTGIGDADPGNVAKKIIPHIIRMSETRAVARAMRFATNIGMTALEELGENEQINAKSQIQAPPRPIQTTTGNNFTEEPIIPPNGNITNTQIKAIYNIGKRQGWTNERIKQFVIQMFNLNIEHLDKEQACAVIREMQNNGG